MAGKMKQTLDKILDECKRINPTLVSCTRAKLCLKGIYPDKITETTEDDPVKLQELINLARELNIEL